MRKDGFDRIILSRPPKMMTKMEGPDNYPDREGELLAASLATSPGT
jgi:hypothetical protein